MQSFEKKKTSKRTKIINWIYVLYFKKRQIALINKYVSSITKNSCFHPYCLRFSHLSFFFHFINYLFFSFLPSFLPSFLSCHAPNHTLYIWALFIFFFFFFFIHFGFLSLQLQKPDQIFVSLHRYWYFVSNTQQSKVHKGKKLGTQHIITLSYILAVPRKGRFGHSAAFTFI